MSADLPKISPGPASMAFRTGPRPAPDPSPHYYNPRFPRWLPPTTDDGSTKGVRTTLPVVDRRGRSGSAPYQADLAIEYPTHCPIRVLRAHPGFRGTHLSYRVTWMLLDGGAVMAAKGPAMLVGLTTGLVDAVHNVRFGSLADIDCTLRLCPLSGVKRT